MIRIGVVVQRYGQEVVGGAETLARSICEKLAVRGFDVTVLTTTALDYITWENHYPAGETILRGVTIRRFPVSRPRDIDAFNRLSDQFFSSPADDRDEEQWIEAQGPVSAELLGAIAFGQDAFDLFVFFTYLYYPTVKGLPGLKRPAILFPTAHDEPPIYLRCMRALFAEASSLLFLTHAEMDLVCRLFSPACPMEVVGTGIDIETVDERDFRLKYFIFAPFILYAGRIEKGKGLEAAFSHFQALRRRHYVDFVLIGKKLMDIPKTDGIKYLGFVPEKDKLAAFKAAILSLQPSPRESLSISTLESFSQKTPVLVNRECRALVEHVELSGGGATYGSEEEFLQAFRSIHRSARLREKMGAAGLEYVRNRFSWEGVLVKIEGAINRLIQENR